MAKFNRILLSEDPALKLISLTISLTALSLLLSCGSSKQMPPPPPPPPQFTLVRLSTDTLTNPGGQHATELETSFAANGSTAVVSFEVSRGHNDQGFPGGSDIGHITTTDGGTTWQSGFFSGLTTAMGGSAIGTGNASIAYDAMHGQWLIETLLIPDVGSTSLVVLRSSDGLNWSQAPVLVNNTTHADKPWIACDNSTTSPFFGHCYIEWDTVGVGTIWMSTSHDGGMSWSAPVHPAGGQVGNGGQPQVQPNGTVIVPIQSGPAIPLANVSAFRSTDGGVSWSAPVTFNDTNEHNVSGFRTGTLSSAIDGAGKVYVAQINCDFRTACAENDLVLSTSNDGLNWSQATRIPLDPVSSSVEHFEIGLAADPATSGATAHLTLTYYFYPDASCTPDTCKAGVAFVTSHDGGNTWSTPVTLADPMPIAWLADSFGGKDVGDYISSGYINGKAFGFFAIANAPSGATLDQAIYTTKEPLDQ